MNKFWDSNVYYDFNEQFCILNFKFSRKVDLNCPHYTHTPNGNYVN